MPPGWEPCSQTVFHLKTTVPDPPPPPAGNPWSLPVALAIALALVTYPIFDLDLFWHLANGRAMVQNGHIINSEAFSFTHFGEPFINHAWLAEVLFFRAWAAQGTVGLYAVKATVVLLTAWLLWRTMRKAGLAARDALPLVPLVVLAGLERFHVRPEMFSILGITALAAALEAVKSARIGRREVWLVPALFAVWDWTHGAIIGWAYLLVFIGGEHLRRLRGSAAGAVPLSRLNLCLGLTLLVGLINPYGPRSYGHFLVLAGGVSGADRILELQPLWDQTGSAVPFAALLLVALVLAAAVRYGMDLTDGLLATFFTLAALRYGRLAAVAAIVVGLVVSKVLAEARCRKGRARVLGRGAITVMWATLLLAGMAAKFGDHLHVQSADEPYLLPPEVRAGFGLDELRMPAAAVRFVLDMGLNGNIYNNGNLGGYLAYHLAPRQRIFQYNMPPIFGDTTRFVREPLLLARWDIVYAFAGTTGELTKLFPPQEWAWVFSDYVSTVVVRRTPAHADLIRRYELRCFSPEQPLDVYRALAADPNRRARLAFEMGVYLTYAEDARIAERWTHLLEQYQALTTDPDVTQVMPAAAARNHLDLSLLRTSLGAQS